MASTENFDLSDLAQARSMGYDENGQSPVYDRALHGSPHQNEQVSLPRADGGRDAWLFLAGCFCIEALTWGKHLDATFPSKFDGGNGLSRPITR